MYDIKLVSNVNECERLWKLFSPNELLFDLWDVRMCYYKEYPYPLEFYTAERDGIPSALLALQFNTDKQRLETFGGGYFCYNRFFGEAPVLQDIVETIDKPLYLYDYLSLGGISSCSISTEPGYIIDISGMHEVSDHIRINFSGKSKNRIKNELKRLMDLNFSWTEGTSDDLDRLIALNVKRFSAESFFNDQRDRNAFYNFFALPCVCIILLICLNDLVVGISYGVLFNGSFTYLTSGIDQGEYTNVSLYLNYRTLETAIYLGALHFDALSGDNGWKKNFHMQETPLFQYVRNYSPPE